MMSLGLFHPTLPRFVVEEIEYVGKGLLRIIQHIREGSALAVSQKVAARDRYPVHATFPLHVSNGRCNLKNCICTARARQADFSLAITVWNDANVLSVAFGHRRHSNGAD